MEKDQKIYLSKTYIIQLLVLSFMLFACGNEGDFYRNSKKNNLLDSNQSGLEEADYSQWVNYSEHPRDTQCPESSNIKPRFDSQLDGSYYYSLCKTTQSKSIFYLDTETPKNGAVCIFPAYYAKVQDTTDQYTYFTFKTPGAAPATPLSVCINPQDQEHTYIDFSAALNLVTGSQVDAAFIVPFSQRAQMAQCLSLGNPYYCPIDYSFGNIYK